MVAILVSRLHVPTQTLLRDLRVDVVYLCLGQGVLGCGVLDEPGHASPAQAKTWDDPWVRDS